ncbi:hypothetical protein [Mesorhizobium sp. M0488]|uniref:hypothetical protein n=1 Tax=unclassified Mesorhizobium TaxID=325217 RepID=UPI0033398ED8
MKRTLILTLALMTLATVAHAEGVPVSSYTPYERLMYDVAGIASCGDSRTIPPYIMSLATLHPSMMAATQARDDFAAAVDDDKWCDNIAADAAPFFDKIMNAAGQ